ncbi:PTS sugar transporter subunit IIA [Lysinibacter cavernae]|uniref:Ascorbate-specific PTS system EIIA component n=1 Tax=Lysinibacter cavernae TaxID=1640652 RepID=A0A7X5TUC2_9MICO|nr:PTS sugar transporter subunit IIA [Lysinibacter cavernae]NIH53437.1 PTS system ascorbate-specific IIA component [Lysinibacter cavernae]
MAGNALVASAVGTASGWEDATLQSAALLVNIGAANADYPQACVDSVHANGPYIVLTKGLALAHARPEAGALGRGLSLLRLEQPVEFGHQSNDPVDLVLSFCALEGGGHLEVIQNLAIALQKGLANELRTAEPSALDALLEGVLNRE